MAQLEEELEAVQSIFMEDVSCGEHGEVGFTVGGQHVLTLRISSTLFTEDGLGRSLRLPRAARKYRVSRALHLIQLYSPDPNPDLQLISYLCPILSPICRPASLHAMSSIDGNL